MPLNSKGVWRRLNWWLTSLGPRRDITLETANGLLTFSNKDWLIGKHLYVRRAYEISEIEGIISLLQRENYLSEDGSGTVLDVGANLGMVCIALIKRGYFRRAAAFEPTPDSYRLLVHNIRQNDLQERILHFQFALSSNQGTEQLELSPDNSGDNRIRKSAGPGFFGEENRRAIPISVRTLDQALELEPSLATKKIDLIWLDIQGHEGHFLAGARRALAKRVSVVAEFWPYAINRAGMTRTEFMAVASELFTHFYQPADGKYVKRPVSQMDELFDQYSGPRQMCQLVLVADRLSPS